MVQKAKRAAKQRERRVGFAAMVRDAEGEANVKKMAQKLEANQTRFVDASFPADARMLFADASHPAPHMKPIQQELAQLRWLRPHEMGNPSETPQVFAEGIEPEDIHQGSIGDCYFLAALAICATREELINDLIVEDFAEQGIYGVKFYREGKWETIVVDDLFPCRKSGNEWLPIFAKWKGSKETWAMVAEKAWAKLHGSYEAINGGRTEDTLSYLSGGCSISHGFKDLNQVRLSNVTDGTLWDSLIASFKQNGKDVGVFMSASGVDESKGGKKGDEDPRNVGKKDAGLVAGHAYSVLNMVEVEGHKLIQVRNPWGSYEWDGAWSDESPLWTPSMKKAVNFVAADDGAFWMSFDDFTTYFAEIGVCKTIPSNFETKIIKGEWTPGRNSGGRGELCAHYNPTYVFTAGAGSVWIQLEQPDQRRSGGDWNEMYLHVCKAPEGDEPVNIALTVCPVIVVDNERQKTIEFELKGDEGPLYIVVAAWRPGVRGTFIMSVHCESDFTLNEIASPKPDSKAQAAMASFTTPTSCCECKKAVDHHTAQVRKGVTWHPTELCYKCGGCKKAFSTGTGKGMKLYDIGLVGNEWHGYCFQCWSEKLSDRCLECGKVIFRKIEGGDLFASVPQEGKIHMECKEAFRLNSADKCSQCSQPVVGIPGKFSGRYLPVDLPNGKPGKVHEECQVAWLTAHSQPCVQCQQPVCEIHGKFSGKFYALDGSQRLHVECSQEYEKSKAPKCVFCHEAVCIVPNKFSGRYLSYSDGAVHEECNGVYLAKHAEKCIHCHEAVAPFGKFSGSYYQIEGKGRLHEECQKAWSAGPK